MTIYQVTTLNGRRHLSGTDEKMGLLEQYLTLSGNRNTNTGQQSELKKCVGNRCPCTLSILTICLQLLYQQIRVIYRPGDCRLSFLSPVGLLLSCNHLQPIPVLDNSEDNLQKF
jgi:hypothetical protein